MGKFKILDRNFDVLVATEIASVELQLEVCFPVPKLGRFGGYLAVSGAVNTSTTPKVQYAYSEIASGANHSRLTSIAYPSGYVLTFNYTGGINDNISRLSSHSDATGKLESNSYLGLGTVVICSHPQPANHLASLRRQPGIRTWRAPGVSRGFVLHGNNDSSSPRRQPGEVCIVNQRPHDGRNHRVTNTVGSTTTNLYYSSQWQVLEETVGGVADEQYVWSPVYVDAMVIRDRDTDSNGTLDERLWHQDDANWNVTTLANASGAVVERYVYDAYGVQTVYDGSYTSRASSLYSATYGFQGRPADSITGNYDNRMRLYDPILGRPMQLDPLHFGASDVNFYRWEGNRPTFWIDPSGLQPPFPPGIYGRPNPYKLNPDPTAYLNNI